MNPEIVDGVDSMITLSCSLYDQIDDALTEYRDGEITAELYARKVVALSGKYLPVCHAVVTSLCPELGNPKTLPKIFSPKCSADEWVIVCSTIELARWVAAERKKWLSLFPSLRSETITFH